MNTSPKIDAYIERAASFAQPILHQLRAYMHQYCPEGEETMKWSFPHYTYRNKHLFSMAAFRQHCICGFRMAPVMSDPGGLFQFSENKDIGHMTMLTSVNDLPGSSVWKVYIQEAMQLTADGIKLPKFKPFKETATILEIPELFLAALKENEQAIVVYEAFPPATRSAYIQWVNNAKHEVTRQHRIATSVEWIASGKRRYWKYEKE